MSDICKNRASRATRPLAERFWEKVQRGAPDECWEWTGGRNGAGYGVVYVGSSAPAVGAHRVSLLLSNGPITPGSFVLHSCDNRGCVNPAHLRQGTNKDNMRDMVERGRWRRAPETHCVNGHEFTVKNTATHIDTGGGAHRQCRICAADSARRRYLERKAAAGVLA